MATTLKQNLNSNLIEAYIGLLSKKAPKKVLVYVESDDDIAFWYGILKVYETAHLKFDIQLPSRTSLAKGKNQALERRQDLLDLQVGAYLIVCIDSDYDYLLQHKTKQSALINSDGFIFQTYAYSNENLRCFSGSLNQICVQATNSNNDKIDFDELLKLYSKITYPLFLWSVFFKFTDNYSSMPLHDFCNIVRIGEKIDMGNHGKSNLEALAENVNAQIEKLKQQFPNDIKKVIKIGEELHKLGVNSENTYLFIQGHTIENSVVLMFLNTLCRILRKEKEDIIKTSAKHKEERIAELNHYKNHIVDVKQALKSNTEYKSCFLYEKIKSDLDIYMGKIKHPSI
jgi:Protein of unknown function (DUF4435)